VSLVRPMAPLVDLTLLRAINALLASHASAETLLIVRDAVAEGAAELGYAGQQDHSAQLGWISAALGIEADKRRETGPLIGADQT